MNNEATYCAVLSPALRAVERTTSIAAQHSALQYSVPRYKPSVLKMHGSICLAIYSFLSVILHFLIQFGLIKLFFLPYACKRKVMPVHSMKAQRSKQHDVFRTTALHGRQKSNTDSSIPVHRLVTIPTTLSRFQEYIYTHKHTYIRFEWETPAWCIQIVVWCTEKQHKKNTYIHTYIYSYIHIACRKLHNEESHEYRFTKNR